VNLAEPPVAEAPYDPGPPEPHLPSRRRGLMKLLIFFAVLLLLFAGGAMYVRSVSSGSDGPSVPVAVVIPNGATAAEISNLLEQKKIIRNAWLFRFMARMDGRAGSLKPGEYDLRTGMSYGDVLDKLEAGPVIEIERITIPEGKTVREIVAIVREKTSLSANQFQAEIDSGRYRLPVMPKDSKNLEGLLFPKTYDIREGMNEGQVLQMMLDQFTQETDGLDFSKAPGGVTPYEAVVIASLIEREAKIDEDRAKIAGVIYNRIRRGMRLQIDATVQYAILQQTGSYKSRLTYADYEIESPYNTYRIDGVPPAPIASPGLKALQAALSPAQTDAIYYVLCDKRGGHAFARTAEEFDRLKRECASKR
jgi:UPF0755 protein